MPAWYDDPERHAIVSPEIAQQAAEIWTNCEVVQVNDAGHCIHRDQYETTMQAVRAFLSKH